MRWTTSLEAPPSPFWLSGKAKPSRPVVAGKLAPCHDGGKVNVSRAGAPLPKAGAPGSAPPAAARRDSPRLAAQAPSTPAPPSITGLFDPIASLFSPDRDDHPSEIERMACELVGLTQSIAADQPLPGGPDSSRPSRITGMAPPGDAEDMLTSAALALAESQQFRPEARYVDCLRPILPFCASSARGVDTADRPAGIEDRRAIVGRCRVERHSHRWLARLG